MKFLKLTMLDGEALGYVWVNVARIVSLYPLGDDSGNVIGAMVTLSGDSDAYQVKETPESILMMLGEDER